MNNNSDKINLGILPFSKLAASSKKKLATDTLDSSFVILNGMQSFCSEETIQNSLIVLKQLRFLLLESETPGKVIEPEYYYWYFQAIKLLEMQEFNALKNHISALPLLTAIPLAYNLKKNITVEVNVKVNPLNNKIILGEREHSIISDSNEFTLKINHSDIELISNQKSQSIDWKQIYFYGNYNIPDCPITLQQSGYSRRKIITEYQKNLSAVAKDSIAFSIITPDQMGKKGLKEEYISRFRDSLLLIKNVWPELFEEICVLTDSITLLRGYPFIGGSTIKCYGVSFFNLLPEWSIIAFADHIVHEAAHQRLHAEFEVNPIILNLSDCDIVSPIRPDPRPVEGIFHATFVFLRLSLFFEKLLNQHASFDAETRFHRHLLGLYHGIEQLERHAKFTSKGDKFFSLVCEEADRLKKIISSPNPKFYNKISPDYEIPANLKSVLQE